MEVCYWALLFMPLVILHHLLNVFVQLANKRGFKQKKKGLKQGDALSPLLFNFALEYAIRKVHENHVELQLNGTHELLTYADDLLGDNINTIKNNKDFKLI
jgi:hypothetical protein